MAEAESRGWRRHKTVLVTDAQAIGAVAVIRSLGRAGYRVVACSERVDALGLCSKFCSISIHQPSDSGEFFAWLDSTLAKYGVELIVPSEGFLLNLRPQFHRYQTLLPMPSDQRLVFAGLSKFDLFSLCTERGLTESLPPFLLVENTSSLPGIDLIDALGLPLFVKADAAYSLTGKSSKVLRCNHALEALQHLRELSRDYSKLMVQGFVPGVGVGAFLANWNHVEIGTFMHRRLHEVPHTGGVSSYRRSWKDARILDDARSRMQCLNWQGVGMFEYRWNPTNNKFYLLEFNSRFWGSLHLALFAGVDFPMLLADAFFGKSTDDPPSYRDVSARLTFPGELGYLLSRIRDSSLSILVRLQTLLSFIGLGMSPKVHSDLWFPGDRGLYWRAMYRSLRDLFK